MLSVFGICIALAAAFCWALATRLYRLSGAFWHPVKLSFIKNSVTLVIFVLVGVFAVDQWQLSNMSMILLLLLSGAIGIGIGDSALFAALKRIGERETLIIAETLAPIILLVLGMLLLGEWLTFYQFFCIVLIILAVDWTLGLRKGQFIKDTKGIIFAMVAASCQAIGALISRYYLSTDELSVLESAIWRMAGGLLIVSVWLRLQPRFWLNQSLQPIDWRAWLILALAILFGTLMGVYLLQWSMALLPAAVAQTLLATSILFAVVIGLLFKEVTNPRHWLAASVAVVGIALLSFESEIKTMFKGVNL